MIREPLDFTEMAHRFHTTRNRVLADEGSLRENLILISGQLIGSGLPESSAVLLIAAGRLYPDLVGFVPRILGPDPESPT